MVRAKDLYLSVPTLWNWLTAIRAIGHRVKLTKATRSNAIPVIIKPYPTMFFVLSENLSMNWILLHVLADYTISHVKKHRADLASLGVSCHF